MQITTLSTQLRVGTELIGWYRDATFVMCNSLIDLSPLTDDRLRYRSGSTSIPSKLYVTDRGKQLIVLHDGSIKSFTLQLFQSSSRKGNSQFLQSCLKEFIGFLCECINLLRGNLQSMDIQLVAKLQKEVGLLLSLKRTISKQRRSVLASAKRFQPKKVHSPPVNNHLP